MEGRPTLLKHLAIRSIVVNSDFKTRVEAVFEKGGAKNGEKTSRIVLQMSFGRFYNFEDSFVSFTTYLQSIDSLWRVGVFIIQ